jgi:hypothetical protein
MLKRYLENILLTCIPVLAAFHVYDMSLHSLLAVVLIHENSSPKYYLGSGMILLSSYTYFATHEQLKIMFSIFLTFSLLGCGFTEDMKRLEEAHSVNLQTGSCDLEEELLPASPEAEPELELPEAEPELELELPEAEAAEADSSGNCERAPEAATPATPPPAEELRSREKKRPRIVAKLAAII